MSKSYDNTPITTNIYKYQATGYYILGKEKYPIDYSNFRSIVIDHDYDKNNMPLIYIILNLSSKVIDLIVKNKDTGVFIINIQKCIDNSDMPDLWKDYVNDTFIYFTTEDINKTDERDYENSNEGREDIYKEITLGLLSQKLVNNNKKTVNGILNCDNMASAVAYTIGYNLPLVMEPFENNNPVSGVLLPPMNSVSKSIEYLNGIKTFYNSKYLWYMDFDTSYLLSSRGKGVPRKGEQANSVMFVLRNDYDESSKLQGMTIDENNRYYNIEVSGTNVEVADYRDKNKQYSKVNYVDTSGNNSTYTIHNQTNTDNFVSKAINVRVPNDNTGLITNSAKTSNFFISINKTDIDASIITPNKEFIINAEGAYKGCGYSGKFLLKRKRELYFKSTGGSSDNKLTLSTLLFFEKVYEE